MIYDSHYVINAKFSFVVASEAFLVSILDARYRGRVHCVTHLLSNQKQVMGVNEPMASGGGSSFSKYSRKHSFQKHSDNEFPRIH